jgi:hypothetical protein
LQGELRGVASFEPKGVPESEKDKEPCLPDTVYAEEGEMPGLGGGGMAGVRWSRRYIWRFAPAEPQSGQTDTTGEISVWFVKPGSASEVDYLFHSLEFDGDATEAKVPVLPVAASNQRTKVLVARGHHLCVKDVYRTIYTFRIVDDDDDDTDARAGDVVSWSCRHLVHGPAKDQDIVNMYSRAE